MGKVVRKVIIILGLPIAAFVGGGWLMNRLAGREPEMQFLGTLDCANASTLDSRWLGHDTEAVRRQWGDLHEKGLLVIERRFLEIDLGFPFLYGGALAISLLMAWASLGRPFGPAWLMAPVIVTVVADWTENLVQLAQMSRFEAVRATGLQSTWIGWPALQQC